jgi:zinc transport system permease protein
MSITGFLAFAFVQRALLAAVLISAACAAIGVFLVLRRLSLIGDGLAHASFAGVAAGLLLGVNPLYAAVPFAVLCSYGIFRLSEKARIFGDAAIGMAGAAGIACGAILSSIAGGFNTSLLSYLFGSILGVTSGELWLAAALTALVFAMIIFFYNELVCSAFEGAQARVLGVNPGRLNAVFVAVTAAQVVVAIKVAGVMLVSALIVIPAVSALQLARGFKTALALACSFAAFCAVAGIIFAFMCNLPAGATVVMCNLAVFLAAHICARAAGKKLQLRVNHE